MVRFVFVKDPSGYPMQNGEKHAALNWRIQGRSWHCHQDNGGCLGKNGGYGTAGVNWSKTVWPGLGHRLVEGMREREGRAKDDIQIPEVGDWVRL